MQVFIENYCRMAFILALLLSNMALRLPSPRTRSNPLFSKIKGKGGANERVSGTNIENRRVQRLNWDKMDPDTRVPIGGERFMMPGDFVVHEEFGIGRYVGVRMVDLRRVRTDNFSPPNEVRGGGPLGLSWAKPLRDPWMLVLVSNLDSL